MTRIILPLFIVAATAGCSNLAERFGMETAQPEQAPAAAASAEASVDAQAEVAAPAPAASPIATSGASAEALDTTTAAEREAATRAPTSAGATLGTTVASLATEPGLWLKTPLVKSEQPGRVTNPTTGKSASVTLIPLDGPATAGSRMSLPALRLIGASLTDLTTVEVSAES